MKKHTTLSHMLSYLPLLASGALVAVFGAASYHGYKDILDSLTQFGIYLDPMILGAIIATPLALLLLAAYAPRWKDAFFTIAVGGAAALLTYFLLPMLPPLPLIVPGALASVLMSAMAAILAAGFIATGVTAHVLEEDHVHSEIVRYASYVPLLCATLITVSIFSLCPLEPEAVLFAHYLSFMVGGILALAALLLATVPRGQMHDFIACGVNIFLAAGMIPLMLMNQHRMPFGGFTIPDILIQTSYPDYVAPSWFLSVQGFFIHNLGASMLGCITIVLLLATLLKQNGVLGIQHKQVHVASYTLVGLAAAGTAWAVHMHPYGPLVSLAGPLAVLWCAQGALCYFLSSKKK